MHARTHDTRNERDSPGFEEFLISRGKANRHKRDDTTTHRGSDHHPNRNTLTLSPAAAGALGERPARGQVWFQITLQIPKQAIDSPFFEAPVAVLTGMTPLVRPSRLEP